MYTMFLHATLWIPHGEKSIFAGSMVNHNQQDNIRCKNWTIKDSTNVGIAEKKNSFYSLNAKCFSCQWCRFVVDGYRTSHPRFMIEIRITILATEWTCEYCVVFLKPHCVTDTPMMTIRFSHISSVYWAEIEVTTNQFFGQISLSNVKILSPRVTSI